MTDWSSTCDALECRLYCASAGRVPDEQHVYQRVYKPQDNANRSHNANTELDQQLPSSRARPGAGSAQRNGDMAREALIPWDCAEPECFSQMSSPMDDADTAHAVHADAADAANADHAKADHAYADHADAAHTDAADVAHADAAHTDAADADAADAADA
jgi:hypothetical protein